MIQQCRTGKCHYFLGCVFVLLPFSSAPYINPCVHCVSKHHSSSDVVMDTGIEVPSAENPGQLKACCRPDS